METWEREPGNSPQPECPTCGAADQRHVAIVRPIVYMRFRRCETAWVFRDRRQLRRCDREAFDQFPREADLS